MIYRAVAKYRATPTRSSRHPANSGKVKGESWRQVAGRAANGIENPFRCVHGSVKSFRVRVRKKKKENPVVMPWILDNGRKKYRSRQTTDAFPTLSLTSSVPNEFQRNFAADHRTRLLKFKIFNFLRFHILISRAKF